MSSIKRNFLFNLSYQILALITPLITTPYISRVLGPEGTGRYSFAHSVAYYFVMFAILGVNNYGNRTIAMVREDKNEMSKSFWGIYLFQLFSSFVMITLYIIYVAYYATDKPIGWIFLGYVISAALDINWLFFGLEEFKVTVTRRVIIKIISVASIFIFVNTRADVTTLAMIFVLEIIFTQVILWLMIPKKVNFVRVSFTDITKHIKANIVLFVPILAISVYRFMDKIMLGILTNKTEVGFYEASEKIIQVPIAIINSLGMVMLPRTSNLIAKNEIEKSKEYISKSIIFAIFLASSMSFGIMAVAEEFVPLFFGPGFEKVIIIFQALLPSCLFLAFSDVIRSQYLIPNNKNNIFILSVIMGATINIIANILLIPRYASIGAAIGVSFAEAAVCIMHCYGAKDELPIMLYIKLSIPFVLAGLVMYIVLINLHLGYSSIVSLGIKVLLGTIIYFLVIGIFYCKHIVLYLKNKLLH